MCRYIYTKKIRAVLLIFSAQLFTVFLSAQEPLLKHFTVKEGLPSNEVYFVTQDKKGRIWICTDAGIARYNSSGFKIFNSAQGLPDNTIFEVKEDAKGRMWFRSYSGKLGYIFNDEIVSINANKIIPEFIQEGIVCSFAFDKDTNLIVGRQSASEISFLKISPPYTEKDVSVFYTDKENSWGLNILFTSSNDFVFSDKRYQKKNHKRPLVKVLSANKQILVQDSVFNYNDNSPFSRIYKDGFKLYFGNSTVIKEYDLQTTQVVQIPVSNLITVFHERNPDRIWIGSRYMAVTSYGADKKATTFSDINTCSSIYKDNQNGYWFGTLSNGVFYASDYYTRIYNTINNLVALEKLSKGNILAMQDNGDIVSLRFNDKSLEKKILYSPKTKAASGTNGRIIRLDHNMFISAKTTSAFLINTSKKKLINFPNDPVLKNTSLPVRDATLYKDKILFFNYKDIYTADTLNYIRHDTIFCGDRLTSIAFFEKEHACYVGSLHGLYKWNGQKKLSEKDKLLDLRVEDLEVWKDKLLIATKEHGLLIKTTLGYDTIDLADGLISNICKKIKCEDNTIWISTNFGISSIAFQPEGSTKIRNYTLSELGEITDIADFIPFSNHLIFCNRKGLTFYSILNKEKKEERVRIEKFTINGREANLTEKPVLPFDSHSLKFYFEALFYNNRSNTVYRYKLNTRADWVYTGENLAQFVALPSGEYNLLLEAKNSNGNWIASENYVSFTIEKPFWTSWWFILIEAAVIIIATVIVLKFRNRQQLKKERLQHKINSDMQELKIRLVKAQMNPHFIFNSLNSIQEFILSDNNESAYKYLSVFSKFVRKVLESNTHESISIEDETDLLTRYIELEALRLGGTFSYTIERDEQVATSGNIPHMIIQPFVENALWHGLRNKKGDRLLNIRFIKHTNNSIKCVVEDNGTGRKTAETLAENNIIKSKSLGLTFTAQRLEMMSKLIETECGFIIIDKKNETGEALGTRAEIIVPLIKP